MKTGFFFFILLGFIIQPLSSVPSSKLKVKNSFLANLYSSLIFFDSDLLTSNSLISSPLLLYKQVWFGVFASLQSFIKYLKVLLKLAEFVPTCFDNIVKLL